MILANQKNLYVRSRLSLGLIRWNFTSNFAFLKQIPDLYFVLKYFNMKKFIPVLALFLCMNTYAQYEQDVVSPDAIIKALYDAISGPTSKTREWNRFRFLFGKEARMLIAVPHKDSGTIIHTITPEQYIDRNGKRLQEIGFVEKELHRITETHGAVTHIFSTYQSDLTVNGTPQQVHGINSIQLFNDGKRYYIVSVFWDADSKKIIDKKYLGQ